MMDWRSEAGSDFRKDVVGPLMSAICSALPCEETFRKLSSMTFNLRKRKREKKERNHKKYIAQNINKRLNISIRS